MTNLEDVLALMRSDKSNEWPDEIKVIEEARDIILELAQAYQAFYGGDFHDETETTADERDMVARALDIAADRI